MHAHVPNSETDVDCAAVVESDLAAVVGFDAQVPLLDGRFVRAVNLDTAASTPPLRIVLETVNRFMEWYSNVHRGAGFKSRLATQAFEEARARVGGFVGARAGQHGVIFGKNTTEAINTLADCVELKPGEVVLCSQLEHHSNLLPWRRHATVDHIRCDVLGRLDETHLLHLLQQYAGRVRLVVVSGASNVTGHIPAIHALAAHAHAAGAEIAVDGAQLAAHRAIDLRDLDDPEHLDYVAIAGHKMYAPFGSGALIGRRDTFACAAPRVVGGGSASRVTLDSVTWNAPPGRHEAGTPNLAGAIAMAAAVGALQSLGMDAVAAHGTALSAHAMRGLTSIAGLRLYGGTDPEAAHARLGIFPFTLEGVTHGKAAAILSAEFGIAVRNGSFCAQPLVRHLLGRRDSEMACGDRRAQNAASDDPGLVRASIGIATTAEDIDRLVAALRAIAGGDYRGTYARDAQTGHYDAAGWDPDFSDYFDFGCDILAR